MTRLPRFWVYLLWCSDDGSLYTGFTGNLCRRFKEHNSPSNRGYTKGKRWRLLAVKCFLDRNTALLFEKQLKTSKYDRRNWIKRLVRYRALCDRHDIAPKKYLIGGMKGSK